MIVDILNCAFGWGLGAVVLWLMITTMLRIHKDLGISTVRGGLWALTVIAGNLLGVLLYRYFRAQIENMVETMFESW
jgi:hypothetical protein